MLKETCIRLEENLIINGGMLAVDGDYRIQSLDNKRVPARLIMLNKDDYIVVKVIL